MKAPQNDGELTSELGKGHGKNEMETSWDPRLRLPGVRGEGPSSLAETGQGTPEEGVARRLPLWEEL